MDQVSPVSLEELALKAAREIAGPEAFEKVEIFPTETDWGEPAYAMTFLMHPDKLTTEDIGEARIDIRLRLREELEARGQDRMILMRMLDQRAWPKRPNARTA